MNKFTGLILITLFIGASADSFTNGMATGYISSNVERNLFPKKEPVIKYNNFTRDTVLVKFPPNPSPQCILEKIKIVNPPLTLVQKRFVMAILFTLITSMFFHILFFASDETRQWFIGYIIGRILENVFNDDD